MLEKKLLVKGNTLDVLRTKLSGQVNYDKVLNESNTTTVETVLIGLDDFSNFEAKYKELKKVYTVNATHKLEFFDSRYNILNDDITPSSKTLEDTTPTADHTYTTVWNVNTFVNGFQCLRKLSNVNDDDIVTVTFLDRDNVANISRDSERPAMFVPSTANVNNTWTHPIVDSNFSYVSYRSLVGKTLKLRFRQVMKTATVDFGYYMILDDMSTVFSHRSGFALYDTINYFNTDNYTMTTNRSGEIAFYRDDYNYNNTWPNMLKPPAIDEPLMATTNIDYANINAIIPENVCRVLLPTTDRDKHLYTTLAFPQGPNRYPLHCLRNGKLYNTGASNAISFRLCNVSDYADFAKYTVEQYAILALSGSSFEYNVYPAIRNLINYYTKKKQGVSYDTKLTGTFSVN